MNSDDVVVGSATFSIIGKGKGKWSGQNSIGISLLAGKHDKNLLGDNLTIDGKIVMYVDKSVKYYTDIPLKSGWKWLFTDYEIKEGDSNTNYIEYIGDDYLCYRQNMFDVIVNKSNAESPKTDLSKAVISFDQNEFSYMGFGHTPKLTVRLSDITLNENVDYITDYVDNVNAGEAKALVHGKSKYNGTAIAKFTIKKAENSIEHFELINNVPVARAKYGEARYQYYSDSSLSNPISKPTAVGVYYVVAIVDESDNWKGAKSKELKYEVLADQNDSINDQDKAGTNKVLIIALPVTGCVLVLIAVAVVIIIKMNKRPVFHSMEEDCIDA